MIKLIQVVMVVSYNEMEDILNKSGIIKFKYRSLEYIIKKNNLNVEIFVVGDIKGKRIFNSFYDVMNNYLVYNESLVDIIDKIQLISYN